MIVYIVQPYHDDGTVGFVQGVYADADRAEAVARFLNERPGGVSGYQVEEFTLVAGGIDPST